MTQSIPHVGPRRGPNRRVPLLIGAVVLLLLALRGLPALYVDYLWFREVGFVGIFRTTLWTNVMVQLAFGLVFFAFFTGNLLIAIRRRPPNFAALHELRQLIPAVEQLRPALRLLGLLAGLLLALLVSRWAEGQWLPWLWFRHAQSFGVKDPVFGLDTGFYVFTLPFVRTLAGFAMFTPVLTLLATAGTYLLQGHLWARPGLLAVNIGARRHLMLLIAFALLLFAAQDVLARFGLLHSTTGIISGAGFADLHGLIVAHGPGSFTGLRIGFATAKRVWHARQALPLESAPSLLAAASSAPRLAWGPRAAL